ncbi:cytochrome b N-terminal domain-containing protein [Candidatus Villigracilis affinis]|uniref:cytochrome b N-terminal domain-containing protein n=1 Tax=Candidatus Villigracilis affinis TaxID=3140682 RepID=UPI002A19EF0C|nr:cytochrome bc complex cytochrome b subunit [Anaerolineales bacterium]
MMQPTSHHKNKQHPMRFARLILIATGIALLLSTGLLLTDSVNASRSIQVGMTPTISPSPTPTFDASRLDRPNVPAILSQVDEGQLIFWGVCIACHGDRGQGLTDEWRLGAYKEDGNCWQSGCHGKDHPPHGFEIPKTLVFPALSMAGSLGRFQNAQQLYDYVVEMMPWWNPRSLGPEKAWQVTAYLLKLKGSLPDGLVLNETNASAVPVHRKVTTPQNTNTAIFIFLGTVIFAMIGLVARDAFAGNENASISNPIPGSAARPSFFAHLHPPTIPAMQARWRYTLGAGGAAVFLSLVLVLTGLLEMFYYIPTPEKAAISVETITSFVPFGALVRNLHYWSAQWLVLVALIHLARIIFTGAYSAQRKFNFLLGLGLLVFILLLDFTGYVLRWDEGIRWALTAGTNLLKSIPWIGNQLYEFVLGGSEPGPAALIRFYSWHIFVLSLTGAVVMIWHLFRVRRDGGIAAAPAGQREDSARITRAELLRREILGMFFGGVLLVVFSILVPAPIAAPMRGATIVDADSSAPWFFLWVQQLLKLGDPFLLGILLPLGVILFIGAMPYLFKDIQQTELGRWFPRSGQRVQLIFILISVIIMALTALSISQ